MATPWNLEETRSLVQARHGRDQLELVRGPLRSVVDRQAYARIHYQDALAILDAYMVDKLSETSLLDVTFAGSTEDYAEFTTVLRRVSAHLVACMQSMHSLADILAHVAYYALALNRSPSPLPARAVNISSLIKELRQDQSTQPLASLINPLLDGGQAKHLAALVNHGKHRSIIFPALNEDWTGERPERHQVVLSSFEYEGQLYPQVGAREFLETEYNRCSPIIIAAGNEINRVLRGSAA